MLMKAIDEINRLMDDGKDVDWKGYEQEYRKFVEEMREAEELAKIPAESGPEEGAVVFGGS